MCKAMDDWRKEIERKAEKRGEERGKIIGKEIGKEIGRQWLIEVRRSESRKIQLSLLSRECFWEGGAIRDIAKYTGSSSAKVRAIAAAQNLSLN